MVPLEPIKAINRLLQTGVVSRWQGRYNKAVAVRHWGR
jgi:hypothetical protein